MSWITELLDSFVPPNRQQLFFDSIVETLQMVGTTLLIGGFIGLLLGLALYATRTGNIFQNRVVFTLINIMVNIIRPIPFVIFIAAIGPITLKVVGTTVGQQPFTFAMIIVATFYIARIVEQNLITVDPGIVEAARSMGASKIRILATVIIPEALAPLILGYTFAVIAVVDISALAYIVAGGGLGSFAIQYGYNAFDWRVTFFSLVLIVIVVQIVQLLGNTLAKKVLRHGA